MSTSLLARHRGRSAPPPDRARERLRGRLLREPGRRGAHRGTAPGVRDSWPSVCRAWEDATAPAAEAGIRVVRLRSGVVLSARGGALARQLPLFRYGIGGRLGNGRQWLSWITLADEVRRHPLRARRTRPGRAGQRHRTRTRHQPRLHRRPRPSAAPAVGSRCPGLRPARGAGARFRFGDGAGRPTGPPRQADGHRLHLRRAPHRRRTGRRPRLMMPARAASVPPETPSVQTEPGARFSTTLARSSPPGSTARTGMVTPLST